MADEGRIIKFIIVITFLASFFFLTLYGVSTCPQLFTEGYEEPIYQPRIENYTDAEERLKYSVWMNGTLEKGYPGYVDLQEGDLKIRVTWNALNQFWSRYITGGFLGFVWGPWLYMPHKNPPSYIHGWNDVKLYLHENLNSSKFTWRTKKNDRAFLTIITIHNTTRDASLEEAWNNGEIEIYIGATIDDLQTAISAWNVIGALLTFQTPQVHPVINFLIAIPIYACIIYLIITIVAMFVPFGGGP